MLKTTGAFSSYSINDLNAAKEFYGNTLGLNVSETPEGLNIKFSNGLSVFLYQKDDHAPATFTVLNFQVDSIEDAVNSLGAMGITLEKYGPPVETDERGILWGKKEGMGPNVAWFKDPAGNILSLVEE